MPNIQDHAIAVGGLSLAERPFDALDSLILAQLVYMPMEGKLDKGESCTLLEAWRFLRDQCDCAALDPFQQKRYRLTEVCAGLARYQGWQLHDYINNIDNELVTQFCALTFEPPSAGFSYVAFRGTDLSLAGWKEDLNMSFMTVPAQTEAAEYVQRIARQNGDALFLGGHSKGGNLAVYAGAWADACTRERIRRVYSFDGPGLDETTMLSEGYQLLSARIESYIPQSSVVGMLLAYHPIYTVVRAHAIGILQHDAMTWQVENGRFVQLGSLDLSGKLTDEALHAWLCEMTLDDRRLLVNTLYRVIDAAQAEQVTDLLDDWRESTSRILEAIRDLSPEVKKSVRRMLHSLFTTGALQALRNVLQGFSKPLQP
ncbi:MAG: Mbeg1-like protein [Clostridia bacterium]